MIAALAQDGAILPAYDFVPDQIQPASLDLRLGEVAYRVRASFLPGPNTTVAERIDELKLHEIALGDGAVLETNCVYIVPLIEGLALPDDVAAAANPKSSTGRLDVFTRVIADETRGFDRIKRGYHGPLYTEISPRTFPVLVREGSRLSQIRFRHDNALLDAEALRALHARERLVDDDDADVSEGIAVSVDLVRPGPRRSCRLPRQTPHRPYRCRASRRLRRDRVLGTDEVRVATRASSSTPTSSTFWPRKRPCRCRPTTRPKWSRSIRWWASSACTMPASSIPASAMPAQAGAARARCWKCARAKCPSSWSTARSWAARLREDAGAAKVTLRRAHRLELPGAGAQTVEAFSDGIVERCDECGRTELHAVPVRCRQLDLKFLLQSKDRTRTIKLPVCL